jgi:SAM-dependent methyltransferase
MTLPARWLVLGLLVGAALAYSHRRRRTLGRVLDNFHRYSMPSAAFYDACWTPLFGGFYTKVARNLAAFAARARVLEIGPGPGHLAVELAQLAPHVHVTGVDISPDMVERATSLASRGGVAGRAEFRVGDVAALPFPDASFDVVVSTFSLHHWPNPAAGLAEIHRVLRPGGVARVYDLVNWITRLEQHGVRVAKLIEDSPFGRDGAWTYRIAARAGPVPLVYLAELKRQR